MILAWSKHLPVSISSFKNGKDFSSAIQSQTNKNFLVLIDYELLGQDKSGLDLISELQIENQSILITSHFEKKEIVAQCRDLGVGLIPKMMISLVPVILAQLIAEDYFDFVYIEDEELLRMSWLSKAKKKNIRLLALSTTREFEQNLEKINFEKTAIYIDNNLKEGDISGLEFAQILHLRGYQNIFIASGYEAEKFAEYTWLNYAGKKCPI